MNLHLFINPQSALDIITELDQCYEKAVEGKSKREKKGNNPLPLSQDGPEFVEVVVDLLLLLLSKGDHYWRKIAISIFR